MQSNRKDNRSTKFMSIQNANSEEKQQKEGKLVITIIKGKEKEEKGKEIEIKN